MGNCVCGWGGGGSIVGAVLVTQNSTAVAMLTALKGGVSSDEL